MSDIVLLTQAGYLTVKGRRGKNLLVSYPNREVACAMAALYAENLFQSDKAEELAGLISECAESGDAARIMEELNRAFLAISCMAYPVRSEAVCQGLVQLFFMKDNTRRRKNPRPLLRGTSHSSVPAASSCQSV